MLAGCELDNDSTNSATIYPESASLKAEVTNIIEFIADGGNNNYKWSMNNDLLGTLFIATSNTAFALYQNATNTGANIISVRDSGGKSANARIVQK
jgi:hypothetical protein